MVACWLVATAFLALNGAAVVAMATDKHRAQHSRRRISEAAFYRLAMIGAVAGIAIASALFRHKSRKRVFQWSVWSLGLVGILVWSALAYALGCFP